MEPSSVPQPSPQLRLLTKRWKSGNLYQRDALVENQIKSALLLSSTDLIKRATLTEKEDPGYLQEESLIYLIRAYHKVGNREIVEYLFEILVSRCQKFLENNFVRFDHTVAEEACQDVWTTIADEVLHPENGRGDYLEVRFWDRLYKKILSVKRHLINVSQNEHGWISLADLASLELEKSNDDSDDELRGVFERLPIPMSVEQRVIWNEGFQQLLEPTRTIFFLYHFEGWQIDSKDPCEPTISKLYQRSSRMIKYRLEEAEQILKDWRGNANGH